jgi:hypothetical protein
MRVKSCLLRWCLAEGKGMKEKIEGDQSMKNKMLLILGGLFISVSVAIAWAAWSTKIVTVPISHNAYVPPPAVPTEPIPLPQLDCTQDEDALLRSILLKFKKMNLLDIDRVEVLLGHKDPADVIKAQGVLAQWRTWIESLPDSCVKHAYLAAYARRQEVINDAQKFIESAEYQTEKKEYEYSKRRAKELEKIIPAPQEEDFRIP